MPSNTPQSPAVLPLALLLGFLALFDPLAAQPVNAPVMPLSELHAGQKGEVWTVFKGSKPESFSVEVTGVLQNALGPGKNLILCELTDPRIQPMGAVAGMSGSPLYIDGKVAGVLAYQIQRFETVRYAGFTPIADMLEVSALPAALGPATGNPIPIPIKGASDRRTAQTDLAEMRPFAPVFSLGGLSPQVASLFAPQFQALGMDAIALGGSTEGSSSEVPAVNVELRPGDVVAAALAVGDISIAATGTVSHVDGRRILAFGHPMLSLGTTEIPMAAAEVVAILPSQLNSVKVSNTGQIIGAFSQDRLSGIYGEIGRQPQLVPIDIELPARLNRKALHFSVVRQEQILPVIAASGLAQAVAGSNEAGFAKGFRLVSTVEFPGEAPLKFSQLYPGPQGFQQGVTEFVGKLQQCLFNPFERIFPSHIHFSVEEIPEVPLGFVDVMQVSRTETSPGANLTVTVNWHDFQQAARTESLSIPVPAKWAGKQLEVVLVPGALLDELTGRPKTESVLEHNNFSEYLDALRQSRPTDGLYLAVLEKTRLFSDQRSLTPELPGSLERIAHAADESRFQRREATAILWEARLMPGRIFSSQSRKPLTVTD